MKKTLAAMAVLGAFAGTTMAADVTLYGVVDLGLKYTRVDSDKAGESATNKLEMASGNQSGARFGLKGAEDLGNGMKVGFVLENGFSADDGKLGNAGRLFGREAILYVDGGFGQVAFGRTGQLTSYNGSYGLIGGLSPFGASWGGTPELSTYMVGNSRIDNTVTYKTPTFAGVNLYAQYSFDMNNAEDLEDAYRVKKVEGQATAYRYAALGATYKGGALNLVATADYYNWSSARYVNGDVDDGFSVTAGGNFDFGVAKAYLGVQYFDNMFKTTSAKDQKDTFAKIGTGVDGQLKGYGVIAGVDAPVLGGTAMFAVGYNDAKTTADVTDKAEAQRWGVGVGYTYALSKRTNLYGVAGDYQDKIENEGNVKGEDRDPSNTMFVVGMRHKF